MEPKKWKNAQTKTDNNLHPNADNRHWRFPNAGKAVSQRWETEETAA
jgi:hypothetical protein